ncbi:MAG: winged helix-turn-helix domain-containing protein [Caldivirga sp.]|jgi:predicted transcriptional regulator
MVRRRSRVEIIMQILEYLSENCSKPTKMATALNLAYDRLDQMLQQLRSSGLVVYDGDSFCISSKGLELLREYQRFRRLAKSLGIDV